MESLAATRRNSIMLSEDKSLLYLIDNGRAIPFALNKGNGVLVTVLRGQITVVSAPDIDREREEADIPEEAKVSLVSTPRALSSVPLFPQKMTVPVPNNLWSLNFFPDQSTMIVVGATDISGALTDQRRPNTTVSFFSLRQKILNIRRENDSLVFLSIRL